ncbi:MAG TPA: hypothetical protein VHH88_14105 [Verrucomicrobiae bacterium]|nr:hypothetical protein [Verrucomicrobiae bacterium]
MSLMLAQANSFCGKLGLPLSHAISVPDVRDLRISPQVVHGPLSTTGLSGSIMTRDYAFGFGEGHLANYSKLGFTSSGSDADVKQRNRQLAEQASLVDTNGACRLATNWLARVGVDVGRLDTECHRSTIQWQYYPDVNTGGQLRQVERNPVLLPVFRIEWRGTLVLRGHKLPNRAVVTMTVSGAAKELVDYHIMDDSLVLTPRIGIRHSRKLLAISDEDFQKLDPQPRSSLVSQFSGRVQSDETATPTPDQRGR